MSHSMTPEDIVRTVVNVPFEDYELWSVLLELVWAGKTLQLLLTRLTMIYSLFIKYK